MKIKSEIYKQRPDLDTSNTWFINIYGGLGDILIMLGYLESFRKFHQPKKIVVLARHSVRSLVKTYSQHYDAVLYFKSDVPQQNSEYYDFGPNKLICTSKAFLSYGFWVNFAVANRIPFFDWYKMGFRIPMAAKFCSPDWTHLDGIKTKPYIDDLIKTPTVVICPFTAYGSRVSMALWHTIGIIASKLGKIVFTNTSTNANQSKEQPDPEVEVLEGTQKLECSLDELFLIAKKGNVSFICGNGGLALLLSTLTDRVCIVYNNEKVASDLLNSSFPNEVWDPISSHESVKRNMPWTNVFEVLGDEACASEIQHWLLNSSKNQDPKYEL